MLAARPGREKMAEIFWGFGRQIGGQPMLRGAETPSKTAQAHPAGQHNRVPSRSLGLRCPEQRNRPRSVPAKALFDPQERPLDDVVRPAREGDRKHRREYYPER